MTYVLAITSAISSSGSPPQSSGFLWALAGIIVFIQFLPYIAILFSRRIGSKFMWLMLFVAVTAVSWGAIFLLGRIESDFIAASIVLFPNYFLYAVAISMASKAK